LHYWISSSTGIQNTAHYFRNWTFLSTDEKGGKATSQMVK